MAFCDAHLVPINVGSSKDKLLKENALVGEFCLWTFGEALIFNSDSTSPHHTCESVKHGDASVWWTEGSVAGRLYSSQIKGQ